MRKDLLKVHFIKTKYAPRGHMVSVMRAATECYNNNYNNKRAKKKGAKRRGAQKGKRGAKRRPRKAKRVQK